MLPRFGVRSTDCLWLYTCSAAHANTFAPCSLRKWRSGCNWYSVITVSVLWKKNCTVNGKSSGISPLVNDIATHSSDCNSELMTGNVFWAAFLGPGHGYRILLQQFVLHEIGTGDCCDVCAALQSNCIVGHTTHAVKPFGSLPDWMSCSSNILALRGRSPTTSSMMSVCVFPSCSGSVKMASMP